MQGKRDESLRDRAITAFRENGGVLKTSEASKMGIRPEIIYELVEAGILERLQRGFFCIAGLPDQEYPDYVIVSKLIPRSVVCLVSALYFHRLTNQVPHFVDIAVPQGTTIGKVDFPPIRVFKYSESTFRHGIVEHDFSGALVRIFCPEKTIVDCFKHRSKTGLDIAIEALRLGMRSKKIDRNELIRFSRISKVESIMRPYIEMSDYE